MGEDRPRTSEDSKFEVFRRFSKMTRTALPKIAKDDTKISENLIRGPPKIFERDRKVGKYF